MNFYKRHIGDYIKATSHLSLLEHGIYNRLLDVYYTRESGIPEDQTARLIGARTSAEKHALKSVLLEFFELVDGQWRQGRCDEEILDAAEFGEEREAKQANEKERQRRHREERKKLFEVLRSHGIVPAWDTKTQVLRDHLSRVTGPLQDVTVTPPETESVTHKTCSATAIQTPQATNQKEEKKSKSRCAAPPLEPVPDPRKQLWDLGVSILGANSRSLIAKAISDVGESQVGEVLGLMATRKMADPRSYFAAAVQPEQRGFVA